VSLYDDASTDGKGSAPDVKGKNGEDDGRGDDER
jgi:hypothetical protein